MGSACGSCGVKEVKEEEEGWRLGWWWSCVEDAVLVLEEDDWSLAWIVAMVVSSQAEAEAEADVSRRCDLRLRRSKEEEEQSLVLLVVCSWLNKTMASPYVGSVSSIAGEEVAVEPNPLSRWSSSIE